MQRFGFPDAAVTPSGADGGVDVRARDAVAQVKARNTATPRPDVQQLHGIASAEGKLGVFFSLNGYTPGAIEWAESRVALFVLESTGNARPIGALAEGLMNRSVPGAVGPDETLGALLSQAEEHGSLSSRLLVHLAPGDMGVADGRALAEMVAATIDKPLRVITADQLRSDSHIELRLLQRLVAGQVIYLEQVELFRTGPLKLLLAAFCNQLVLRPSDETVADVVGEEVLARVRTVIEGARERKSRVPHLLFSGPPGTCKTTLAAIVANMMEGSLVVTSGPVLARVPNLAGLLMAAEGRTVVFIDEIHRMPPAAEEDLYEALKDGTLSITVGSGNNARAVRLKLPSMLFIGATTEPGALSQPLRDRFGVQFTMEPRSPDELTSLVRRVWDRAELAYEDGAACLVAERSKGMPWRARHLALRLVGARTEAAKRGTAFTADFLSAVFDRFAFNDDGFTETDWMVQDVGWGDTTLLSGPHGSLPAVSMIASTSIPWERGSDARDGLGPLGKAIPYTLVMPRLHSRNAMMLRWEVRDIPLMR
jgi:Holliday junction resolvasome RuvABC ATP-dependent DNA helicase subunit